jgi:glucosamine-6-phosphate deaminase
MSDIDPKRLYEWCRIPAEKLVNHPRLRVPFRLVKDSAEMGRLMASELAEVIAANNAAGKATRAIIPCGPKCWYEPFAELVNSRPLSLAKMTVFHMDECLDWQGRLLPRNHPYNFRTFMERYFYGPVRPELNVPESQRHWVTPQAIVALEQAIAAAPIDITVGGWGQDGHMAYNQAPRSAYSPVTLEEMANSTVRIQNNNLDTIMALAQRTFGSAWQFAPPMSVTLGVRQCLSAAKVRVYSDTGSWKQTALRAALFAEPTVEYPMTLMQRHKDAIITATLETARHPVSENPEWELF